MRKLKVLLLSGYHASSHQHWCEQLCNGLPEYDWTVVSLPDRYFYWRIRSNALTFAFQNAKQLNNHYDIVLATSMVDLCNLRGLVPQLAGAPSVLYFHENQFAYPQQKPNSNLINAQLTSIYSALTAQKLVFNSQYNFGSFIHGASALLTSMPDGTDKTLLHDLPQKSLVIPVPIDSSLGAGSNNDCCRFSRSDTLAVADTPARAVEIVWNHRWEYDKQPEVFFEAITLLIKNGHLLRLHVMGQQFRTTPDCFSEFKQQHEAVIDTWGYQSIETYRQVLRRADIVVSSALHDFQGLGMLEAIACGCLPVAPDRMAYPEYIPAAQLYTADGEDTEAERLYARLSSVINRPPAGTIDIAPYTAAEAIPLYDELLSGLAGSSGISAAH